MLRTASAGDPLEVPADSGGSFLHMEDLARGLDLCLGNPKAFGRTFNLSTVYVTWEEVAEMVRDATGSRSEIRCVPREKWTGSAFLADPWELSDAAARELLGYRPMDPSEAKSLPESGDLGLLENHDGTRRKESVATNGDLECGISVRSGPYRLT